MKLKRSPQTLMQPSCTPLPVPINPTSRSCYQKRLPILLLWKRASPSYMPFSGTLKKIWILFLIFPMYSKSLTPLFLIQPHHLPTHLPRHHPGRGSMILPKRAPESPQLSQLQNNLKRHNLSPLTTMICRFWVTLLLRQRRILRPLKLNSLNWNRIPPIRIS